MSETYNAIYYTNPDGSITEYGNTSTSSQGTVIVPIPIVDDNSFTYNGTEQGITFTNLNPAHVILTNGVAIDAGTYTATATLKGANDVWSDLTNTPKNYTWTIAKADPVITLDPTTMALDNTTSTGTVTVSWTGVGSVLIESSNTEVATVSVSTLSEAGDVTVTGLKNGSANVTVTLPASTNYNAATATCAVSCAFAPELVIGNTYFFGGFWWTAAEDLGDNCVCMQSQGMTSGTWPGYKLTSDYSGTKSYGNANTYYTSNIDGDNIANYDATTQAWYTKYSSVEKTGASYGSGLFLVSNTKCNQTTSGYQGSGNYWLALKTAATNHRSFGAGAGNSNSWLSTVRGSNYAWCVNAGGSVDGGSPQYNSFVIAPAFNLDLTKVKLVDGDHIMLPTEEMPTLKTFATATDAEIAAMVEASDKGIIDLYEDAGWRVGQEHQSSISAIASSGTYDGVSWSVGESQDAQSVTFVLMDRSHYNLTTTTSCGKGRDSFVVGVKNFLGTYGYMNSTATNTGSWSSSARRAWCNGGFRQALPSALRGIFKQFKVTTATEYNASTTTDTNDYFALFAEKEIFGSATYSNTTEANALSSITWYETSSNRIKKQGDSGSAYDWWERSPNASRANFFCRVSGNGNASAAGANGAFGLSPFGCL